MKNNANTSRTVLNSTENNSQGNFISVTIPQAPTVNTATILPIQVVNVVPCQTVQLQCTREPNGNVILRRPPPQTLSLANCRVVRRMTIQDPKRKLARVGRSRARLFSSADLEQTASEDKESTEETNKDQVDSWINVATGQSQNQKQLTKDAQNFLELNPCSPKRPRRIAVVPLLRMNCTKNWRRNARRPLFKQYTVDSQFKHHLH